MQKVAPHTIPPKPGEKYAAVRNSGGSKNLEPSPALQLAQRIRYEQGAEQLRRYLTAIEPFIAPAERAAIAKQMGIQIVKAQQSAPKQAQSEPNYSSPEEAESSQQAYANQQSQHSGHVNNSGSMNQQMQMMQLLSQLAGGGMPGLGNLGNALNMNNGGGLNPMLLAQLLNGFNKK